MSEGYSLSVKNMDIKQLKYFISIADFGSMTRASESLNIAQPALTQQMAKLEADIQTRVFDRGTSGVKLTPAGAVLYRYAKSIVKQINDARLAVADEDKNPTGKVTIGIPGSTGKLLSVPLFQQVKKQGRVLLEIVERPSAELLALVASGKLDIAVVVDAVPVRGVALTPMLLEDLLVIARKDSVGARQSLSLKEVARNPLVLPSWPSTIRQRIDTALMDAQLTYQLAGEVSATDMLVRIVRAGIGWTLLPWSAVSDDINRGHVVALPIRNLTLRRELSICVSDTLPLSIAAQSVKDSISAIVRDLISSKHWMRVELGSTR
jgi:LysR family transcriptional regulator, nitrogen assimilation regulatory protein